MQIEDFISKLNSSPDTIEFNETMAVIEVNYNYKPTAFTNGAILNQAGENEGSCKLFAFAQLQNLSKMQTLSCFGSYYRDDVLKNPEGNSHQNIRNFMQTGWHGIEFDGNALIKK